MGNRKGIRRALLGCLTIGLCLAILSGCGREEESEKVDYYDIVSKVDSLFVQDRSKELPGMLLGTQYYQGEPVQLWSDWMEGDAVYLTRTDGSREELMEIPRAKSMHCYLDRDGNVYCWEWFVGTVPGIEPVVRKYDASGQEVCQVSLEKGTIPQDICQMEDGRLLLLLREGETGALVLAEFDTEKGALSRLDQVQLGKSWVSGYIAAGKEDLVFLEQGDQEGVSKFSLKDGKRETSQSFQGGSYVLGMNTKHMELEDFRVAEDGSVEILWASRENGRGVLEKLQLKEIEKTVLVMQTTNGGDIQWVKEKIREFNQQNESYYLILKYATAEAGANVNELTEYGQMIAMQMGTGKGPDILVSYALNFVDDLAGKGGIVDLAPYMAESGMREEDYFPSAFSRWRNGEKIYTVSLSGSVRYTWLDGKALGLEDRPDIASLLDALLTVEKPGNYFGVNTASGVLIELIQYTDDYCGILDWEKGVCDFEGELFVRMMQAAGRFGYTWDEIWEKAEEAFSKPYMGGHMNIVNIYEYESLADMEKQGKIPLLSENGAPYSYSDDLYTFAVNANSAHVEGAWEFLSYMMSEEVQRTQQNPMKATNRAVCVEAIEKEVDWLEAGNVMVNQAASYVINGSETKSWTREDITDEKVAEFLSMRDRAEPRDGEEERRMKPVWQSIEEEAEAYFVGDKSIEEVAKVINNRVQLYLDENH